MTTEKIDLVQIVDKLSIIQAVFQTEGDDKFIAGPTCGAIADEISKINDNLLELYTRIENGTAS